MNNDLKIQTTNKDESGLFVKMLVYSNVKFRFLPVYSYDNSLHHSHVFIFENEEDFGKAINLHNSANGLLDEKQITRFY